MNIAMSSLAVILLLLVGCASSREFYVDEAERIQLRDQVKEMFYHAYDNYMKHAFPMDELRPISCKGHDTFGRYSLTLIDSLDALAVLGNNTEFEKGVWWVINNVNFDIDMAVSVFETNIRILGGLLSAHSAALGKVPGYENQLLNLAIDVGNRLLPAFDTPTGMPYGTVNLRHGVPAGETTVTCTAGVGTFSIEFGVLSKLSGNPIYEQTARKAIKAIFNKKSSIGLLGNHIDVATGEWTHRDSGIGSGIDSIFEYLYKAAILFQDQEYLDIFTESYTAINTHVKKDIWYVDVQMSKGGVVWPLFGSLQAFWPGVQVLFGDVEPAIATVKGFHSVWRRFGFTPEGFNLVSGELQAGQRSYPLRPELVESLYYMSLMTEDPLFYRLARDIVHSINNFARVPCGFAVVQDVETHQLHDHMDSFFLAETCKYLYLLFDRDNEVNTGDYVFNTEGHILPFNVSFYNHAQKSLWSHPKCQIPTYLRRISADVFELVGVPQDADEDLSNLVDYADLPASLVGGECGIDDGYKCPLDPPSKYDDVPAAKDQEEKKTQTIPIKPKKTQKAGEKNVMTFTLPPKPTPTAAPATAATTEEKKETETKEEIKKEEVKEEAKKVEQEVATPSAVEEEKPAEPAKAKDETTKPKKATKPKVNLKQPNQKLKQPYEPYTHEPTTAPKKNKPPGFDPKVEVTGITREEGTVRSRPVDIHKDIDKAEISVQAGEPKHEIHVTQSAELTPEKLKKIYNMLQKQMPGTELMVDYVDAKGEQQSYVYKGYMEGRSEKADKPAAAQEQQPPQTEETQECVGDECTNKNFKKRE